MDTGSAGTVMTVQRTLLVQLNSMLTDRAVRELRDLVGRSLEAQPHRGLVLDLKAVEAMDSYVTRCVRDLAICARMMGVPTVVCGVQPTVADTLVEMDFDMGDVRTVLSLDVALRVLPAAGRRARGRS